MSFYLKCLISWVIFLLKKKKKEFKLGENSNLIINQHLASAETGSSPPPHREGVGFAEAVFDFHLKGTNSELGL